MVFHTGTGKFRQKDSFTLCPDRNHTDDPSHPILIAPHTVLTPHAAYWSEESGEELRTRTTKAVIDILQGRKPMDCLNPQVLEGLGCR